MAFLNMESDKMTKCIHTFIHATCINAFASQIYFLVDTASTFVGLYLDIYVKSTTIRQED